ncbi:MAG: (Fe-S)-binding protein [Methanothrix sp.]|nr:(Fe-S)-binding protein [Methanothrix sp.]
MSETENILENCTGCKLCIGECDFLEKHCSSPKELAESFRDGKHRSHPEIPYSCNICGLCEVRCPQKLNIGKMCLEVRRQLVREGLAPLEQHKQLAEALNWNESDAFKLALPAYNDCEAYEQTKGATKRAFFPGCALSACSPDLVIKVYDYLRQKLSSTGIILGCCGAPAYLVGEESRFQEVIEGLESDLAMLDCSEIIVACPYCLYALKRNLPDHRVTSLYSCLEELGLPEKEKGELHQFSVHDPCSTRQELELQRSIRNLIRQSGHEVVELEHSGEFTQCCGLGGMAFAVAPDQSAQKARRTIKETEHDLITYCASCLGNLSSEGASILHVLDLIFGESWQDKRVSPPADSAAARENQRQLKLRLQKRAEASKAPLH